MAFTLYKKPTQNYERYIGPRVAINIARIGMMKADFVEGALYAYCNRLPEAEKEAALGVAKRILA